MPMSRSWPLHAAVLLATLAAAPARAEDTVLTFSGACDNSRCRGNGVDGTTPAHATATITLSDLAWEAAGDGWVATFSDAFDLGYQGAASFLIPGSTEVDASRTRFFSRSASVDGIVEFDITWGVGGGGYLAGDATGWGLGVYSYVDVGGVPIPLPMNLESSTVAGVWQEAAAVVPEPASAGLLSAGLVLLAWRARHPKRGAPGWADRTHG